MKKAKFIEAKLESTALPYTLNPLNDIGSSGTSPQQQHAWHCQGNHSNFPNKSRKQ